MPGRIHGEHISVSENQLGTDSEDIFGFGLVHADWDEGEGLRRAAANDGGGFGGGGVAAEDPVAALEESVTKEDELAEGAEPGSVW